MNKQLKTWRRLLADEWRWFRSHGGSLAAYIQRYGRASDPEPIRFGEGGERIYEADLAALRRKIEIVLDMTRQKTAACTRTSRPRSLPSSPRAKTGS